MSKKTEETVEAVQKEEVMKEAKKKDLVYMGPSITGTVRHATVFKDGVLPEAVNTKIREIPLIQSVFVPLESLVETVKELRNERSAFSIIYKKIEEAIRKERA